MTAAVRVPVDGDAMNGTTVTPTMAKYFLSHCLLLISYSDYFLAFYLAVGRCD